MFLRYNIWNIALLAIAMMMCYKAIRMPTTDLCSVWRKLYSPCQGQAIQGACLLCSICKRDRTCCPHRLRQLQPYIVFTASGLRYLPTCGVFSKFPAIYVHGWRPCQLYHGGKELPLQHKICVLVPMIRSTYKDYITDVSWAKSSLMGLDRPSLQFRSIIRYLTFPTQFPQ